MGLKIQMKYDTLEAIKAMKNFRSSCYSGGFIK